MNITEEKRWLWRLDQARELADADSCRTILQLFDGQLNEELKEWLQGNIEARVAQADKAQQHIEKLTARMIEEMK